MAKAYGGGLPDAPVAASDEHPARSAASRKCLPRSICQRCLAHKMRSLQSKMRKQRLQEGLAISFSPRERQVLDAEKILISSAGRICLAAKKSVARQSKGGAI